jgi:hypothetical protein
MTNMLLDSFPKKKLLLFTAYNSIKEVLHGTAFPYDVSRETLHLAYGKFSVHWQVSSYLERTKFRSLYSNNQLV